MNTRTAPAYLHKLHAALVQHGPGPHRQVPYRVTFTGSRDPIEYEIWQPVIVDMLRLLGVRTLHCGLRVSHGQSRKRGIDYLVDRSARALSLEVQPYPVSAGEVQLGGFGPLVRNARMLDFERPDLVIGMICTSPSHGTAHCLGAAEERGIPTVRVTFEDIQLRLPVVK